MADVGPAVTIGLPVYNGVKYVGKAISSILSQDFTDFELLIADNASTDGTTEVCYDFERIDDRVTVLPSDVNRGAAWNFNRLVRVARGRYFKWAAFDDLHGSTYLSRTVEVLDSDESVVLCHAQTLDIDADGQVYKVWQPEPRAEQQDPIERFADVMEYEHQCFQAFALIRSKALCATGLIGAYSSSDRTLLAELSLHGRFHEVDEPLFLHREHEGRSIRLYPSDKGRAEWFDTADRSVVTFPFGRLAMEFHRASLRAPLSVGDHLRAEYAVLRWVKWHRQTIARELIDGSRALGDILI